MSQLPNSVEHTLAYLARLDLQVRREVLRLRLQHPPHVEDEFRGLYVSDEEVEMLLNSPLNPSIMLTAALPDEGGYTAIENAINRLTTCIQALEADAYALGYTFPLVHLCQLFGLSDLERDTLVICLAAELDLKYERLYAYLQDDVTKKRPTIDLVMRLLCPTVERRLAARRSFERDSPLLRWDLITLNEDPGIRRSVLLARYLKLDERIAGYLLGSSQIDSRLVPLIPSQQVQPTIGLPPSVRMQLQRWGEAWDRHWANDQPVVLFHGRYGTGKRAAATYLTSVINRPFQLLNAADLMSSNLALSEGLKLAEREAVLAGAILGWSESDALLHPEPGAEPAHRAFMQALAQTTVPTMLLAEKAWEPGCDLAGRPFLHLELPEASYHERHEVWTNSLNSAAASLPDAELSALSGRFRLTIGQIHDALVRARTLVWERDPNGHLDIDAIDAACRMQAQHRIGTFARKLTPHYTWEDIVLPRAQLSTLHLVCATVRQRPMVYDDWGFDHKLSLGKGLIALFAGPSGTGKTMAAEIIAHTLGLDLYKIDLAAVVSKYIGETEKNLERIFSEAQHSDAILFFDEADALFGKRSEVKDAHDRYANIETAYLLQRTEEYNGLVILASNLKKNMDEAFIRRLHFTVDFPMPEEGERLAIWQRTFPGETPRTNDIDLPFLAHKLKISGGNIRNIILTAAFIAADDKSPVAMRHLVRAAGYELQKMGKLVVERDFEHYLELARI